MSSKWSVTEVVKDHYSTFVDASTGRPMATDYLGMVALPAAIGALIAWRGVEFSSLGDLVAGVGVFVAALFAAQMQTFSLAQRLTDDPRLAGQRRLGRVLDELEANLSYAVLVGLCGLGLLMSAAASHGQGQSASRWWTGAVTAVLGHLVLTTFMALKRTRYVYGELRS
jgi:hypothetical protein